MKRPLSDFHESYFGVVSPKTWHPGRWLALALILFVIAVLGALTGLIEIATW